MSSQTCALVIGAGEMGRKHAAAWLRIFGPGRVGVLVRHPRDAQRVGSWGLSGLVRVAESERAAWSEAAHWASVCTPTDTHVKVALPLLERGVHVVVEKPLAGDETAADALQFAGSGRCFVAHTCRAEAPAMAVLAQVEPLETRSVVVERHEQARSLPPGTPDVARYGRLLDVLVHDLGSIWDVLPGMQPRVQARWDGDTQRFEASWTWRELTLRCIEQRAAERSARRVVGETVDGEWGWELGDGKRRAWRTRNGAVRQIDTPWQDATEAVLKASLGAVATGNRCPFDASAGGRVMRLAATALRALPGGTFGGAFSWDYVR